jgi:hypothetical protein
MDHNLDQTIALLARTPATLDALLRDLPAPWTLENEGPNTWSAYEVIDHMNHCERVDWMPRAQIILTHGETRVFEPLDRLAQQRDSAGKSLPQLLDEFTQLRAANLRDLRALNLTPRQLALRGTHPAFGSVTLAQLLATWAVHDLTHLHQISRVLAHQCRAAVGPWSAYLGVLQCTGHGA